MITPEHRKFFSTRLPNNMGPETEPWITPLFTFSYYHFVWFLKADLIRCKLWIPVFIHEEYTNREDSPLIHSWRTMPGILIFRNNSSSYSVYPKIVRTSLVPSWNLSIWKSLNENQFLYWENNHSDWFKAIYHRLPLL